MKRELLIVAMFGSVSLAAQQPAPKGMGTLATADARISGGMDVSGARAHLLTSSSVAAYDHTARIDLDRGGAIEVCAKSGLHLLHSGNGDGLLFALDNGAVEIRAASRPEDVLLTPDLRITLLTGGPLDLRIGVTREGDTCVENRGDSAPVLQITESFGDAMYHLAPTQHVRFLHGSVREVVDRELSSCGCPVVAPRPVVPPVLRATNVPAPAPAKSPLPHPEKQLEARIPVAESHVSSASPTPQPASTPPPPSGGHNVFRKIGHFFGRIFHRHSKPTT